MLQLGITIPQPSYGEAEDLVFSWELHVITYQGKKALIAVNAGNCFTVLLWGMTKEHWKRYPELIKEAIRSGFLEQGYESSQIEKYFALAGETAVTKTHGRRPVAALNRMIEFLWYIPAQPDPKQLYQPFLTRALNRNLLKAPGFGEYGSPEEFLEADFKKLKII